MKNQRGPSRYRICFSLLASVFLLVSASAQTATNAPAADPVPPPSAPPPPPKPKTRKKRRSEYVRWERAVPMEVWQLDIVGGMILVDGPKAKVVTGWTTIPGSV